MGINKVILVGNVGKDPVITNTNNSKVASFSFATSESYKNKQGEKVTNTEWHNVVVFGSLTSVVEQFVKKGSQLYLEGKLVTKSYEKNGVKVYSTGVVVNTIEMLGNKGQTAPEQTTEAPEVQSGDEEDLPF